MLTALLLSLRVATVATIVAFPVGVYLAWRLSRTRHSVGRILLDTLLSLPLVLPPSAIGIGLLFLLGRQSAWGKFLNDTLHIQLLFTWQGASIASAIVALPLIIRAVESGLSGVSRDITDATRTEGATEWQTLYLILIPLSYRSLIAAIILGFARALSEFGATLLVAGSIPGETETLPLALYSAIERGDNSSAGRFALITVAIAFVLLGIANVTQQRIAAARGEAAG